MPAHLPAGVLVSRAGDRVGSYVLPSEPTTADLVVHALISHGIDTVFALPGVQNDHLFDAFQRAGAALRLIHTRHEQGAAYMALGASMASGRPAVYCVVPGPGVLNTTAALATAYAVNARVLALTGQIPSAAIGRGLGILHEIPDQLAILRSLTKWAARIDGPDSAAASIDEAFTHLRSGRPRPAAVECAMDVWPKRAIPAPALRGAVQVGPAPIDRTSLLAAVGLLATARRPLIVVGSGAQDASAEITALAERLQAPVIAHRMGHGVLDARHPLHANVVAGRKHWAKADVVLGIGTRLQVQQQWGVDDAMRVIRVDIDSNEIARVAPPAAGIVGDARRVACALLAELEIRPHDSAAREKEIAALRAEAAAEISYLEPQISYLGAIRAELPESGIFVDELTQLGYVSRLSFPVYRPRTFLSPGFQGTLGWGIPAALGAKVAQPDSAVVLVTGDGGFMFNVQELATAVQHRIGIAIVLVNDEAYGNVQRTQREEFGGRLIGSELRNPDFMRLAESFGAHAVRVNDPSGLRVALRAALPRDLPSVIEIPAGPMPDPWRFLRFTRVRAGGRQS